MSKKIKKPIEDKFPKRVAPEPSMPKKVIQKRSLSTGKRNSSLNLSAKTDRPGFKAVQIEKKKNVAIKRATSKRRSFASETLLPPRGMRDILPKEAPLWNKVRNSSEKIAKFYGFEEIETPILEKTELFVRSVGVGTDVVDKEMYTLQTKGGDNLTLRPEGTAPVVRSFIQNGMHKLPQPQKLYYWGPFFRHDRPQAGRYRQFYQFGLEIIGGDSDPAYDAQIMLIYYRLLEELGLKNLMIHINSIGCLTCRPEYKKKLDDYYRRKLLCLDCERRKKENPLRLLDCKGRLCEDIKVSSPSILDSLCSYCKSSLKDVLEFVDEVELPYIINPHLVRGLDYYSKTVFEIFSGENGLALASGGRYDYLANALGWRSLPATGAAMGVDRVVELMSESDDSLIQTPDKPKVFLVYIGELAKKKSFSLMEDFRKNGIPVVVSLGKSALSNQLQAADNAGASLALILGQKEVYEDSIIIRDMDTGAQRSVLIHKVVDAVKRKLKN